MHKTKVTPSNALNKSIFQYVWGLDTQNIVVLRCNTIGVPLPNGGFRPSPQTGWPDLFVFIGPTKRRKHAVTVCVELKASKGDKMRQSQKEFKRNMDKVGVPYFVVRSLDEFISILDEFIR